MSDALARGACDPSADVPTRAQLATAETLVAGSATKPTVHRWEGAAGPVIVKDVARVHPVLRALYGRWVLAREERVLRALRGVAGVPRLFGRVDRDAIAMEFRAGVPWRGVLAAKDPPRFRHACLDLQAKVAGLHQAGVVHLDLKQRRNILVDDDGSVSLLDYESALVLRGRLGRVVHPWFARLDQAACLKFKGKYAADALTDEERRRLARQRRLASFWVFHRVGAALRSLLRRRPPKDGRSTDIDA